MLKAHDCGSGLVKVYVIKTGKQNVADLKVTIEKEMNDSASFDQIQEASTVAQALADTED